MMKQICNKSGESNKIIHFFRNFYKFIDVEIKILYQTVS